GELRRRHEVRPQHPAERLAVDGDAARGEGGAQLLDRPGAPEAVEHKCVPLRAGVQEAYGSSPMSTDAETRDGWSKLFRTAFRQSRNPMALLDAERVVVDVNGAFLRLLGVARDDVVGKPAARLVLAGPALTPEEWAAGLALGHFTGA